MSEENVKFVWEGGRTVHFHKAKKFDTWKKMKTLKNSIEESIKEAKELLNAAIKAYEYGVLNTVVYFDTYNCKPQFKYITQDNATLIFTIETPHNEKEKIREEIKSNPIKAIEKFIENLENELTKHLEYMKEAEPYLTVSIP